MPHERRTRVESVLLPVLRSLLSHVATPWITDAVPELLIALVVGALVSATLFIPSTIGLANNGDFGRIMQPLGIGYPGNDPAQSTFNYVVRYYPLVNGIHLSTIQYPSSTLLIAGLAVLVSHIIHHGPVFDMAVLGLMYILIFTAGVFLVVRGLRRLNSSPWILVAAAVTICALLADMSYIAYFNTLYSEPTSFVFLPIVIGAALNLLADDHPNYSLLALYVGSSIMFVTSKNQNLPLLAFILLFNVRLALLYASRYWRGALVLGSLLLLSLAIFSYGMTDSWYSRTNVYDSVFTGILYNVDAGTARGYLSDLGVDPQYATLAGKSDFTPEAAQAEADPAFVSDFYGHVTMLTIARFYVTHPGQTWVAIERSALEASVTRPGYLGNFEASTGMPPLARTSRLSAWDSLKGATGGWFLWILIAFYALYFAVVGWEYSRARHVRTKAIAELSGALGAMALTQFAIPWLAEGFNEVGKHLITFNFLFDITVAAGCLWIAFRIVVPATSSALVSLQRSISAGAMKSDLAALADHLHLGMAAEAGIGLLTLAVGLYQISGNSLSTGGAFAARLALTPWPVLWSYVWGLYSHSALYLILLHFYLSFTSLMGIAPSESVVRLPSVLCVALSAVIVYRFAWRYLGKVTAAIGSLLYVTNSLVLQQGDQVGAFGFELLVVCIAWYALVSALEEEKARRWWPIFVVAASLQVYIQFFGVLMLGAQVATIALLLLVKARQLKLKHSAALAAGLSALVAVVLVLPILYDVATNPSVDAWISPPSPSVAMSDLPVLGGSTASLVPLLAGIGLLELVVAIGPSLSAPEGLPARFATWLSDALGGHVSAQSGAHDFAHAVVAVSVWLAFPLVLAYVFTQSYVNTHLYFYANFAPLSVAYCLLVGLCVAITRWRYVQVVVALLLVFFAVQSVPVTHTAANFDAWRAPSLWLEQQYMSGDGIICTPSVECATSLDYYFIAYPSPAHFDADSPGAYDWGTQRTHPTDDLTLASYAAQHRRIFLITYARSDSGAGSPQAEQNAAVQTWLDQHYTVAQRTTASTYVSTVTVTLYVERSGAVASGASARH